MITKQKIIAGGNCCTCGLTQFNIYNLIKKNLKIQGYLIKKIHLIIFPDKITVNIALGQDEGITILGIENNHL